ncbi:MAG: dTDP-4-dehydrorhamnose reductase [Deltaproteobacteria bacterium]|nr:dTDP-4-dehydrorhamnose reductase [Deltaproteobacteria bacterium]
MRIFLLGADGQLGHELTGALGCFAEVVPATELDFDMTDPQALRTAVRAAAPDAIVNAAAFTDVDGAERNPRQAMLVNAEAVATLGELARDERLALVHYSTDFVFDGHKGAPYTEEDAPCPLNEYGRSKLAGEAALLQQDAPAVVIRTAWLYSLRKRSFVSSIRALCRERAQVRVVADQIGSPTFCRDLAQATAMLLYGVRDAPHEAIAAARGVYHLAGAGSCSRYELACAVAELDPRREEHAVRSIVPVPSTEYPSPARRPAHAPLDCGKIRARFGIALPPWRESLARALAG